MESSSAFRLALILKVLSWLMIWSGSVQAAHTIKQLRVGGSAQQCHLVFNIITNSPWDGSLSYHSFRLTKPQRLVIDMENTKLAANFNKRRIEVKLANTPLKQLRWAYRQHNKLRLVLDLVQQLPSKISTSRLTRAGHQQLVIDLGNKNNGRHLKSLRDIVVIIDPGHGGDDPGATGARGTHEKTVVLAIAKTLTSLINQRPGYRAYLTRKADYYLTLRQRLAIARRYKADIFVSIHADAWRNRVASGASVFALSKRGATSEAARWIAARENKSELMGGVTLADKTNLLKSVLINLSQIATIRSSLKIGSAIIQQLHNITSLHHHKVEQAAFVVLKSPDIPSLLVETGFISNPSEERRLNSAYYRKRLAYFISSGIFTYFQMHPPRGSWLAYAHQKNRKKKHV